MTIGCRDNPNAIPPPNGPNHTLFRLARATGKNPIYKKLNCLVPVVRELHSNNPGANRRIGTFYTPHGLVARFLRFVPNSVVFPVVVCQTFIRLTIIGTYRHKARRSLRCTGERGFLLKTGSDHLLNLVLQGTLLGRKVLTLGISAPSSVSKHHGWCR